MKDKDIIKLFDNIDTKVLETTDLEGEATPGLETAGQDILAKVRAKKSYFRWSRFSRSSIKGLAAVAACLALIVALVFTANAPQMAMGIGVPEYPDGVSFYDSEGQRAKRQELDPEFLSNLSDFAFTSSAQLFSPDDKENSMYSPLSLFYALALVTEGAEGETHQEMLKALNMPDINLVNSQANKLFKHLYTDNEIGKLLLANSLWLQKDIDFHQEFLDRAAQDYYAHSFNVDFASWDTSEQISRWISEHTGGKLGNNPEAFPPEPEQVLSIINTVYFYDEWDSKFDEEKTEPAFFNLEDGSKVKVPFMNKVFSSSYAQGPDFMVTSLSFKNDQEMLLILPGEGVSPYEILTDSQRLNQAVTALADSRLRKNGEIILSLPKFSFKAEHDLIGLLTRLGVEKAFTANADFTGIADEPMGIANAIQNLSISIDEKGCEATAFTKIDLFGGMPPQGSIEFNLDRPFIFAVTGGAGNAPLFIGVVNDPTQN